MSQIVLSDGMTLSYGYDAEERVTSVVESYVVGEQPVTNTILYTYDALGQLLTETVNGVVVNEMTYDNYGNILTKNGKVYTYGDSAWKDKLTAFDGQAITYDAQGNPLSYLGHTLTWEKGRQLKSFDSNSYTYNANGIRTSKTVEGKRHTYTLDGTKILRETWSEDNIPRVIVPMYDNEDSVCGIIYNDRPFYFVKNLQGDVIAITDDGADIVARYSYDAWGVPTIEQYTIIDAVYSKDDEYFEYNFNIAEINPYRYRGYYYDDEIGLYYLQSRYYNPVIGRFINADEPLCILIASDLQQYNIYCYCENSPINNVDLLGYWRIYWDVNSVTRVLNLILSLIGVSIALFNPAKALTWSRNIFYWAKVRFDKAINKIAYILANSLDTILYELLKKYNSAGKVRITIAASAIAWFIGTVIDFTPGGIVAELIDYFDKDGDTGYISF